MVSSEDRYAFFRRSDVVAEYAGFDFLTPPERRILEIWEPTISDSRLLDIGVGAGRTTLHFAPLAADYIGIDVSEEMIEACHHRFGEGRARFMTADVRQLSDLRDEEFDLVLFSFNGIDCVGNHADRGRALSEMARVLRPGGSLALSCNNIGYAQWSMSVPRTLLALYRWYGAGPSLLRPKRLKQVAKEARRWRTHNPGLTRRVPFAEVVEERPRFELQTKSYETPAERILMSMYWSLPSEQLSQLRSAGFVDVRTFAPDGSEVTGDQDRALARWRWLYHLARRK
jgi:SAM-dependent methyltransferase